VRLHVDHTAAGDSSRRSDSKIHWLEDHIHILAHLNDLTAHEAELLVIVKHSVHVLDPNGIDWAIKDKPPSVLLVHLRCKDTIPDGKNSVGPVVGDLIEITIKLAHGDGLGVDHLDVCLHLLHEALLIQLSKRLSENFESTSLSRERKTNHHESVTHNNHFIQLNDLFNEVFLSLEIEDIYLVLHAGN